MQGWRATKYDPSKRDVRGRYLGDAWTSVSDVGRSFEGEVLTVDEYLRVEGAYVEVATAFHADCGAPLLFARGVEEHGEAPDVPGEVLSRPLLEGEAVGQADLPVVIRSCLREMIWCRLEAEDRSCLIHFGYDYSMYLTGREPTALTRDVAREKGMFLEPFQSPHDASSDGEQA